MKYLFLRASAILGQIRWHSIQCVVLGPAALAAWELVTIPSSWDPPHPQCTSSKTLRIVSSCLWLTNPPGDSNAYLVVGTRFKKLEETK